MANKAFAYITGFSGGDFDTSSTGVQASVVVMDQDNLVITPPDQSHGTGTTIEYPDNSQGIHEKLADAIRIKYEDPNLPVIFLDSPGRY